MNKLNQNQFIFESNNACTRIYCMMEIDFCTLWIDCKIYIFVVAEMKRVKSTHKMSENENWRRMDSGDRFLEENEDIYDMYHDISHRWEYRLTTQVNKYENHNTKYLRNE